MLIICFRHFTIICTYNNVIWDRFSSVAHSVNIADVESIARRDVPNEEKQSALGQEHLMHPLMANLPGLVVEFDGSILELMGSYFDAPLC